MHICGWAWAPGSSYKPGARRAAGFENPLGWKSEVPWLHEGRSEEPTGGGCSWEDLPEAVQFGESVGRGFPCVQAAAVTHAKVPGRRSQRMLAQHQAKVFGLPPEGSGEPLRVEEGRPVVKVACGSFGAAGAIPPAGGAPC